MEQLALALVAFVGSHELLSHPLRKPLVDRLGTGGFLGLYSLVAFAIGAWVVVAFRALPGGGFAPTPATLWVATALMLVASILWAGSMLVPNPALPGMGAQAKNGPQGVMRITRHPMMWSFALWAAVHAAVSGNPRTILTAAAVGFLALFGAAMQDRKKAKLGGDGWRDFVAQTSFVPFGRGFALPGWRATIGGLVTFAIAVWAHPMLGAPVVAIWEYL